MNNLLDRRRFIRLASSALAATPLTRALTAAADDDYRALVCVFLLGGLDCHDVLIPYDLSGWQDYTRYRESLLADYGGLRARAALLPLATSSPALAGRQFALPPELAGLKALYDRAELAFVANVGPLVVPTDRAAFKGRTVALPPRLFSHNDQQSIWQANQPEGAQYGWGGLFADALLASGLNADDTFMALSGGGADLFLTGRRTIPYHVSTTGPPRLELRAILEEELDSGLGAYEQRLHEARLNADRVLVRDLSASINRGFAANRRFASALGDTWDVEEDFPTTYLGAQLRAVARTMAARQALGVRRQLFLVSAGGFDTHSRQAASLPRLLRDIDRSLTAFYGATERLGLTEHVVTFTASDFGRTLAVNGDGTDHGWGGHHLVMGGAVAGAQVLGNIPPPTFDHDQDAGGGRLIPTTAVDQYAGALGRWLGLSQEEIVDALPNLSAFTTSPLQGLFT